MESRTLRWTIAGVLVTAVLGAGAFLWPEATPSPITDSTVNTVNGDGNSISNYQANQEFRDRVGGIDDVARIRAAAREFAGRPPAPTGPWPFLVVADPRLGLKVRSTGDHHGIQTGSAQFGTTVWAWCRTDTGFDPGNGAGSVWYRIAWPHREPTTKFFNSSPSDTSAGWVYSGLTVPAGHSGQIPECEG